MKSEPQRTSYVQRIVGVIVCFSPLLLVMASTVKAITTSAPARPLSLGLLGLALILAGLNSYLSFFRPARYGRVHGSMEGYKHVSGIPLVGTILTVLGLVVGFGSYSCAALGLVALALDTGGLPWFLIATWQDESLWDG